MEKKFFCLEKFLGKGFAGDGNILLAGKEKTPGAIKECNRRSNFYCFLRRVISATSDAVKLAELAAGFSLLAAFLYTGLFVTFTTFQLSLDTINLQFLFQLPDGILKVSTNFNFNHLGLR